MMFSGIIEDKALVKKVVRDAKGMRLTVLSHNASQGSKIGDSIAVNGACLTVVGVDNGVMEFDTMSETLRMTTLSDIAAGDIVNVERSLKVGDRISGHFVTGHIDCTGVITYIKKGRNDHVIEFEVPAEKAIYLAGKGSIAVDGISLTISESRQNRFKAALIPFTHDVTSLGMKKTGDKVNIEFDILAKYALNKAARAAGKIDADFLKKHGFA